MGKYDTEKMLLFQAATSEYGIVVESADIERDLGAFYAALREERGGALPEMQLQRSPWRPKAEIWIVKKSAKQAQPTSAAGEPPPPAITGDITLDDLGL